MHITKLCEASAASDHCESPKWRRYHTWSTFIPVGDSQTLFAGSRSWDLIHMGHSFLVVDPVRGRIALVQPRHGWQILHHRHRLKAQGCCCWLASRSTTIQGRRSKNQSHCWSLNRPSQSRKTQTRQFVKCLWYGSYVLKPAEIYEPGQGMGVAWWSDARACQMGRG